LADAVPLPRVDAGLNILPWLFRTPKRVAILAPPHLGHAAAWEAAGHSVSQIASLDHLGGAAILIAVNPSDADGRLIPHASLAAALPPLKRRDGLLVVDETFADGEESHSILPAVTRLDYTLVLRSLEKFFGVAGVGLGFAITSHPIAGRLRSALGAWPISAQALAFGQQALAASDWAAFQRERLKLAANEVDAVLQAAGLRVLGGTALFRLAAPAAASEMFIRLASKGILTRPFKDRKTLRFGLPRGEEELFRLREALQVS
jgi:cobalamin biosynthetic protein CobC